jgi:hypothetical protein
VREGHQIEGFIKCDMSSASRGKRGHSHDQTGPPSAPINSIIRLDVHEFGTYGRVLCGV